MSVGCVRHQRHAAGCETGVAPRPGSFTPPEPRRQIHNVSKRSMLNDVVCVSWMLGARLIPQALKGSAAITRSGSACFEHSVPIMESVLLGFEFRLAGPRCLKDSIRLAASSEDRCDDKGEHEPARHLFIPMILERTITRPSVARL